MSELVSELVSCTNCWARSNFTCLTRPYPLLRRRSSSSFVSFFFFLRNTKPRVFFFSSFLFSRIQRVVTLFFPSFLFTNAYLAPA